MKIFFILFPTFWLTAILNSVRIFLCLSPLLGYTSRCNRLPLNVIFRFERKICFRCTFQSWCCFYLLRLKSRIILIPRYVCTYVRIFYICTLLLSHREADLNWNRNWRICLSFLKADEFFELVYFFHLLDETMFEFFCIRNIFTHFWRICEYLLL